MAHCYLQYREGEVCKKVEESGDTPNSGTQKQFPYRLHCWETALIWSGVWSPLLLGLLLGQGSIL